VITEGVGVITGGAIGGGNPVGDACNSVTDGAVEAVTSPVTSALKGIGNSIFSQITTWVTEGATWLIEQVVEEIEKTTTPELSSKGFLSEYGQMAQIAGLLAVAMALLAILEAIAQSSWGLLAKAFLVNLPLAFLATTIAFAVVQLLLVATDAMSHAIAVATQNHSQHFFHSAIGDLSKAGGAAGGAVGEKTGPVEKAGLEVAGEAAVPVFVTFLAAIIGAFAAFFVWIELLMRDAAVYVVALFLPMAFAASIWPRWSGALRRTGELLVVVIGSKFVIVSIIALAAGLISEEGASVEHILAASALMLLACFAPLVLFRLVPFAEGAMASAYGRRSAAGGATNAMMMVNQAQMMRRSSGGNWREPEVWSARGGRSGGSGSGGQGGSSGSPGKGGGQGGAGRPGSPASAKPGGGGNAPAASSSVGAAGASTAAAPVAGAAVGAAGKAKGAADKLAESGVAAPDSAGSSPTTEPEPRPSAPASTESSGLQRPGGGRTPATQEPASRGVSQKSEEPPEPSPSPAQSPPRPPRDLPAKPRQEEKS
jgi:type IV secretion system protein TrbL